MLADNMLMIASALAYSSFFAIPSVLLVAIGLFTLLASPGTILTVVDHLGHVMPTQSTELVRSSLTRLDNHPSTGLAMTVVGLVLAIWSVTGAMTSFMTALLMAGCIGSAFLLVAVLLIFGPTIEKYMGRRVGFKSELGWIWWSAQWPIMIAGLLAAFASLLWLGPDVEQRRWKFITPGSVVAVVLWLAISGVFAYYTSNFGSYDKTWGSLAAVIVTLTWLWLSSLALLFGAELNSEVDRMESARV